MSKKIAAPVADHAERRRALDVTQSFIVRAPAGSGKTRLLIQRYLALLATVDEPEEIIAITFTRKAAAEMKTRVLAAFNSAANPANSDEGADPETTQLARAALARDAARGWQLLANSSRLRMRTIDSLNASITRQMPLLARFGAQPESVNDASALYHEAARGLLAQVNDTDANAKLIADDVATLLAHLDNNLTTAENLLADVLRSRDHWLRNLRAMHERETLEGTLSRIRAAAAEEVAALFPETRESETLALARLSGQNMAADGVDTGLSAFCAGQPFPDGSEAALSSWLAIADLLLTKDGDWRKRVDKRHGFPTSVDKELKARLTEQKGRMHALLETFAADATGPALAAALNRLRTLPAAAYSESQWQILGAIVRLLPHATASLWSAFGRRGQCDFTEIAQAAARALGEEDAPTDLALALDYRISHLLVDEFQDTSFAQFELLEKLTRGWSEG
ncbi:MAG: UvrD-helicase domain-containing protein, partial [Usitatibacteraceae bacterium]